MQVNALVYAIGDEADDIMEGFDLTDEEREVYQSIKNRFDEHFVIRRKAIFEKANINRRCQEEGEMVDSYITSLFCLADDTVTRVFGLHVSLFDVYMVHVTSSPGSYNKYNAN